MIAQRFCYWYVNTILTYTDYHVHEFMEAKIEKDP